MHTTMRVRDGARAPAPFRQLRAVVLAAVIAAVAVALLAGCGSSNSSAGAGGGSSGASSSAAGGDSVRSGPGSQSLRADSLKFSRCMRSHGVPNFPDPANDGGLSLVGTGV